MCTKIHPAAFFSPLAMHMPDAVQNYPVIFAWILLSLFEQGIKLMCRCTLMLIKGKTVRVRHKPVLAVYEGCCGWAHKISVPQILFVKDSSLGTPGKAAVLQDNS